MRDSVPFVSVGPAAVVSCHLEQPLHDGSWRRFDALQRQRPGGFDVIALIRPPDAAHGEAEEPWLERARAAAARAPLGLHTHWTSPTHARPTGGDAAARVRAETAWLRERGLEPRFFSGGGWYTDAAVREAVADLGLVDCTPRGGAPSPGSSRPRIRWDSSRAECSGRYRRTCTRTSTTSTCSTRSAGPRSPRR